MKELIDKLSLGIIDYEQPQAAVDTGEILLSVMPGEQREGSFIIENRGKGKLKGILYSTSRHIKIKNNVFSGRKSIVHYVADTRYLKEETTITEEIIIVSNGGELSIPFTIRVQKKNVQTSLGELRNLFHFADLVQKDYDEALKLFCSSRFPDIFLKEDYVLRAKYHALIQGADKNIALDEFLIAANKKKQVFLTTDVTEHVYENPEHDYEDKLVIKKENWGYIRAEISSEGVFVEPEKKVIYTGDFNGNQYELPFLIRAERLHEGYNYGWIEIKNQQSRMRIPILVYKQHKNGVPVQGGNVLAFQKLWAELYHCYLAFRMKKLQMEEWRTKSVEIIAKMRKMNEDDMFVRLVQAQLMLAGGKEVQGGLLLEEVSKKLEGSFNRNVETYCFYLYVKALRERNEQTTKKNLEIIRRYYEQGYENWRLLWMMLYLDGNYDRNESLKLIRMKEQYDKGMSSPLMYYETLAVFNATPSLLRVLDAYEYQTILFGIRYQFLSPKLCERVVDICSVDKKFRNETLKLLMGIYEVQKDDRILTEIVGMLIKGAKTDSRYFSWYERAVEKEMKLTGLYEYYMYSMSYEYVGRIPDVILMYFVYNITLKGERLDFLYSKVIENKEDAEHIYRLYERIIRKYAEDSLKEGRINDKLAVIYREVLPKTEELKEYSENLPDIVNTYLIQCENPDIREVIVLYKEMEHEERVPLIGKKAYVQIFSEDAAVVFEDVGGNRYMQTVRYQRKKLLQMENLLLTAYENQPHHLGLLIYLNDMYFKYRKFQDKAISVMETLAVTRDIRPEYRTYLEKEIIEYYSVNSEEEIFRNYLKNINVANLNPASVVRITELAITRGLAQRGYELLSVYGDDYTDAKLIFKCVDQMMDKEEGKPKKELLELAVDAFRKGKYNEKTLQYIASHYYGSTKDMYAIWNAVKNFRCENRELEEKLIVQMIFTGEYGNRIGKVFESYLANGASVKVRMAYMVRKSYDYFVKEALIDQSLFTYIKRELTNGEELNYLCELAYLKYQSENPAIDRKDLELCRKIMTELCKRNKKFEFYKKFQKYFPLPEELQNTTILEYRGTPGSEVVVHYLPDDAEGDYQMVRMNNVCHGIYACSFILFYGESVKYYITETTEGETNVTESRELTVSREHTWKDATVYGILNNMMVCSEMHEEQTLQELMTDYYEQKKLCQSIFMIK